MTIIQMRWQCVCVSFHCICFYVGISIRRLYLKQLTKRIFHAYSNIDGRPTYDAIRIVFCRVCVISFVLESIVFHVKNAPESAHKYIRSLASCPGSALFQQHEGINFNVYYLG